MSLWTASLGGSMPIPPTVARSALYLTQVTTFQYGTRKLMVQTRRSVDGLIAVYLTMQGASMQDGLICSYWRSSPRVGNYQPNHLSGQLERVEATRESWQNRNGELTQQRRQQPKSGQRQSILNVELTPARDSQHLRTAGGGRARQRKERAQETTQLCGFAKSLGRKKTKTKWQNKSTTTAVISKWTPANDC